MNLTEEYVLYALIRNELDYCTELRDAKDNEQDTREERRGSQAVVAVLAYDTVDNHDEGTRGAANLETATTQQGNRKTRYNRGVQALFGANARGDGECDGERKREDTHDKARHQVAHEVFLGVAPAEYPDRFRGYGRFYAQ